MLQFTISRRRASLEPWIAPLTICVAAALIGVIAGQGRWMFLPAVALIPLLWRWPIETALGGVILLLPFEGISVIGEGERGLMSLAFVVSLWIVFAVGIVSGRLQRPSLTTIWCGAFVAWVASSILWAVRPDISLNHIATVVALFLFFLVVSSFRPTKAEFNCIITLTVVGGVVASLYSLYQFHSGISLVTRESIRATLSAGDTLVNPNRFAVRLLLPLSFAIAGFLAASSRQIKFVSLGCAGIISLALLLIQSRGTLVAAMILIFVFCLRLKVRRGLIPIVLVAGSMIVFAPAILSRFGTHDRGAGRFDIWMVGWAALKHYAVVGAGLGNFPVVYNDYAGAGEQLYMKQENNSHNIYLEVAVEQGLIGLTLLFITIRTQFRSTSAARKHLNVSPIMLVACEAGFCSVLIAGFFGDILWDKTFWLAWVFLAFAITLQKNPLREAKIPL